MSLEVEEQLDRTIFEKQASTLGYKYIVGVDEAGRGPLAGPVVAAACYMPLHVEIDGIKDSKLLKPKLRRSIYNEIINHSEIKVAYAVLDADVVDSINILQATLQAMILAVNNLEVEADYLLVDGNHFPKANLPGLALVKGDNRSISIAAASIVAKETRDDIMRKFHEKWPIYGFDTNMGYGTNEHVFAIKRQGPCPIHRKSFEPIKSILNSK